MVMLKNKKGTLYLLLVALLLLIFVFNVSASSCIDAGYKCTSMIRGCGLDYEQKEYDCESDYVICCEDVSNCGDDICDSEITYPYPENESNCPFDCAASCIESGYKCTSVVRGCGQYINKDLSCGGDEVICCTEIPYCGDEVCFEHQLELYREDSSNCPLDCEVQEQIGMGGGDSESVGSIELTFIDRLTEETLYNVKVSIYNEERELLITKEVNKGLLIVYGLLEDEYTVALNSPGYYPAKSWFGIMGGVRSYLTLSLEKERLTEEKIEIIPIEKGFCGDGICEIHEKVEVCTAVECPPYEECPKIAKCSIKCPQDCIKEERPIPIEERPERPIPIEQLCKLKAVKTCENKIYPVQEEIHEEGVYIDQKEFTKCIDRYYSECIEVKIEPIKEELSREEVCKLKAKELYKERFNEDVDIEELEKEISEFYLKCIGLEGGKCISKFSEFESVCGIDGRTYDNECVAQHLNIKVAYKGKCQGTGYQYLECNGCFYNKKCLPYGTRIALTLEEDMIPIPVEGDRTHEAEAIRPGEDEKREDFEESAVFCDIDGNLKPQKKEESQCQNNYECVTNTCASGACIDIVEELKGIRGILDTIMDFLKGLFGFGG